MSYPELFRVNWRQPDLVKRIGSGDAFQVVVGGQLFIESRLNLLLQYLLPKLAQGEIQNIAYQHKIRIARGSGLLRENEAEALRVEQGKGRKDRYTLLSRRVLETLRSYWSSYRPRVWLFPGYTGEPMSVRSPQKVYRCAVEKAGIQRKGGIHTLRHCFATHLLEAGVDLRTIQLLMGHRSIISTMRYLHVTSKSLQGTPSPMDLLGLPETRTRP